MTRERSLAAEMKAQIWNELKSRYPESHRQFKLTCKSWSTGGSVDIEWIDGPAYEEVARVVAPFKERTIILISTQRRYSLPFLEAVATKYCQAKKCVMPTLLQNANGTAGIAPATRTELLRGIYECARKMSADELQNSAIVASEDGTVRVESLVLKQDYSAGLASQYAVIGRQGYAKMSGPNVWFDIYDVVKRHGPHRVRVVPGSGRGFYFRNVDDANAALRQLATTGRIQRLCTDGTWHY